MAALLLVTAVREGGTLRVSPTWSMARASQRAASSEEAKELDARIILEAAVGQHRAVGSRTVGELLERWFEWRKAVKPISPTTVVSYRALIDLLILPALGKLPLRRLDAVTLDAFYTQLRARGGKCPVCHERHRAGLKPLRPGERYRRRPEDQQEQVHEPDCATGLPLSASRVRHVHAILSGALKQAVVWGSPRLVAGGVDWRTVSSRAGMPTGTSPSPRHFQQAQDRKAAG